MNKNKQLELSDFQRELGQTIGDISRKWRFQMNKHLKPLGLNLSTRQVLITLRRHPEGVMQRDLADKLGIEGPTLVRLLDHLEEKEWIQRVPSPDDKRRKYAMLTPKANDQIKIIEKLAQQMRAQMMTDLSLDEIKATMHLMHRIRTNLGQE
jgi:MarR family transcriptional regulator for hemolysin